MTRLLSVLLICAILRSSRGISTKVDFDDDSVDMTNSTKLEEDDVEVKHTIVVSTKLKNSGNRRELHSNGGDPGILSYNIGRKESPIKEDSGEVPIIQGYKAVETTQIRTPDTRFKAPVSSYPHSVFISRNIRDDYDIYPNLAISPVQWKPSNFYNNINYSGSWNPNRDSNFMRRIDRPYQDPRNIHKKVADDGMKEFYCGKCRELTGNKCGQVVQSRPRLETTTVRMKIDGKLAKLN